MLFKFKKRNINMAKNKNKQPSPFHKGKDRGEGDYKKSYVQSVGSNIGYGPGAFLKGFLDMEKYEDDEWGIKSAKADMDRSFSDFQKLKGGAGENLWAGAKNLIDVENYFGDVRKTVGGMENVREDLTVNQQQVQCEKDMAMQQNVNTLDALRGGGGASGAAALAQSMAGVQSQQRRGLSGMIGQQESANRMAKAQQAANLQQMEVAAVTQEAQSRTQMDLAQDQGAMEAQKFQLQGEADARELQIQMQQAELSYLAGLKESAEANKDADTAGKSDRRLKKNITKIGKSNSGLNIYSFEYKNPAHGVGLFQGVMSDEVPQEAVIDSGDWYDLVNYSVLDVEFKQI